VAIWHFDARRTEGSDLAWKAKEGIEPIGGRKDAVYENTSI
jgi:hypothetical protein